MKPIVVRCSHNSNHAVTLRKISLDYTALKVGRLGSTSNPDLVFLTPKRAVDFGLSMYALAAENAPHENVAIALLNRLHEACAEMPYDIRADILAARLKIIALENDGDGS